MATQTLTQQQPQPKAGTYAWPVIGIGTALFLIMGLLWPCTHSVREGWRLILTHPGLLLSDYFTIGGARAAFLNAWAVGSMGLFLIWWTKTPLSGPTIAAVYTMIGFAFFGKTPLNILPIFVGVYLGTRLRGQNFRSAILAALFGTALGPMISHITFGIGWGYLVGALGGVIAGMILPDLASHLLHNHKGFNLYNIGFTAGIAGTLAAALLAGRGQPVQTLRVWGSDYHTHLVWVFAIYFLGLILVGLLLDSKRREGISRILKEPGTLVTDFVSLAGLPKALINMGLVGLIGLGYLIAVGGTLNGPTLGGLLTIVGFGAFGKHPRNILPVMAGVYLGTFLTTWHPAEPGPLLAALFGTTLAPVAGTFGPLTGMAAGWLHLNMVMHVGAFHGGMNLYNNGFAGGLVATFIVVFEKALIPRWRKKH